ncbi:hypothetical protein M409DRAFT_23558 [Zasmidium cellare ATCC 36951]|uniref:Uncharacterized protein n=1 Tax=Zasmidium cellare ATCC 36951 TaxID=1080233 RepID=A0A6A6CGJ5_ZASCE|nr:uncharacterized protein M409DRAFT_23558 [Zasmidium cellare ATCC 36951]KAF2166367.1 hypothetical protein M409DRAFT_23558 [Zasmidium cellare ATCC 36951]
MPSSSKHETCQEQRLVDWYKVTYAHLFHAGLYKEANIVTNIFSNVLECDDADLCEVIESDQDLWNKMAMRCRNKAASDNVWYAADYMADTAACLFEFGRKKEGGEFCEWAEQLRDFAIQLLEQEEKEKERERWLRTYYVR